MTRAFRNAWKRWRSWSLPTKISIIGTLASLLSVGLYFWDLKPFLERRLILPPTVPNIVVKISNPDNSQASLNYRDDFVLWLPDATVDGAPRLPGKYEIVASDAGLVKNGVVPVKAPGDTRLILKLMDQERLHQYLIRGNTELMFMFHRTDGSVFFSENLPFTEEAVKKFYTPADMTRK
jgi:hypothetical protein